MMEQRKHKKMLYMRSNGLGLMFTFLLSACAVPTSPIAKKTPKQSTVIPPLPWSYQPPPPGFDFKQRCGIDPDQPATSEVFKQSMKSLNFIIKANVSKIKAHIEAQATLQISGGAGSSSQTTDVKIMKAYNAATNAGLGSNLVSVAAGIVARTRSGTQVSTSPSFKDWVLQTGGDNPEYKDLICAVTGTASVQKTDDKRQKFTFTPAAVMELNPLASKEQYLAELGSGREFNVTANVIDVRSGRKIETTTGKVSIMPVNPILNAVDPVTNQTVQVIAESAWVINSDFTTPSKKFEIFNHKTTFYVNHTKKSFDAIIQESISQDTSEVSIPAVILLLQK